MASLARSDSLLHFRVFISRYLLFKGLGFSDGSCDHLLFIGSRLLYRRSSLYFLSVGFFNSLPDHFFLALGFLSLLLLSIPFLGLRCCYRLSYHLFIRLLLLATTTCLSFLAHRLSNSLLDKVFLTDWSVSTRSTKATPAHESSLCRCLFLLSTAIPSRMTENNLASHLSLASFVHEVVENVVVFNSQEIHHVFEFEMVVIECQ